jgi:hypothetical protein
MEQLAMCLNEFVYADPPSLQLIIGGNKRNHG